jgi:S-adenosylmethionine hydrolase
MARPVIALLTDSGSRDHYAGTMKAVVLGICPDVTLVDISHEIPPHDLLTAALELSASAPRDSRAGRTSERLNLTRGAPVTIRRA